MTIKDDDMGSLWVAMLYGQESAGQKRLNSSSYLPWDLNGFHTTGAGSPLENLWLMAEWDALLKNWGARSELKIVDDLFFEVTLPQGWTKVGTDHAMWSDILDERQRKRASVFYKAAFYDRGAFMNVTPRFIVQAQNVEPCNWMSDTRVFALDTATGDHLNEILVPGPTSKDPQVVRDSMERKKQARAELKEILSGPYPHYTNPFAYWD